MKKLINVVAYARFSSDNQRSESIEAQLLAINEFCKNNGYLIIKTYIDEAKSGTTTEKRDQFMQMLTDSANHEFSYVVVHKLDRFARNRYDSAIAKKKLRDNDVKVLSVREKFDDSPESVILESMLEGMNEYYSKNLSIEVKKGLNLNASKGLHNGGLPPLGLEVDPDNRTYIINPVEASIIKNIFDLYVYGYGYGKIADMMNEKGYKTRFGRNFSKNSIHDILVNEKYIGTYVYGKRLSRENGGHKYKPDEEITKIYNAFPAIISIDTWNKAQYKLNSRLKPRIANSKREYILTGFIKCGYCGSSYVGNSYISGKNGVKYPCYCCTGKKSNKGCKAKAVRADLLEDYVLKVIKEKCLNDDSIQKIVEKVNELYIQAQAEQIESIKKTKNAISSNNNKIQKTLDLYYEGILKKETFIPQYNQLMEQNEVLSRELQYYYDSQNTVLNYDVIVNELDELKKSDINKDKRLLIEAFVKEIVITDDNLNINLSISCKNNSDISSEEEKPCKVKNPRESPLKK